MGNSIAPLVASEAAYTSARISPLRRYVRGLQLPGGARPALLAAAPGPGLLAAHAPGDLTLHVLDCNGRHLAFAPGTERLAALAVSPDGRFLLTGGQRGAVALHWLHSLEVRAGPSCLSLPANM